MSDNAPSKISSSFESAKGAIKENAGWAIGNETMQAEGAATRAKADAEYKAAQAQGYAEGTADSFKGSIKDTVGSVIGDSQMQGEGKTSKAKGDAKKSINS
ncbi:glutamate decarboxylase gad1 [Entomophthora muscae]|uniref:Glutamate decarboxylase gad1 n=1 Tax=Entomophthora muscae TaxID=34485 RepID=A0ACC2RUX6_9FUNG|nr:glutamate decarboxylase gad1 [Entomophthora muscae]